MYDDEAVRRHERREAMRRHEREEIMHTIARLLRVAAVAFLATQIPRARLGQIAAAGSRWTLVLSLALAALVLVTALLAAVIERVRDWLEGWN